MISLVYSAGAAVGTVERAAIDSGACSLFRSSQGLPSPVTEDDYVRELRSLFVRANRGHEESIALCRDLAVQGYVVHAGRALGWVRVVSIYAELGGGEGDAAIVGTVAVGQ